MNQTAIYWLKYYWNLAQFLFCVFVFPFIYKDIYENIPNENHQGLISLAWFVIMILSLFKTAHYRIAAGQGYDDTPFKTDYSLFGIIRSIFKFFIHDLWQGTRDGRGIEKLKNYRASKTSIMSQENAAREYISTSALDAIDNSENKRVRDYVNTRVSIMSNEDAINWLKNGMKD